MQKFQKQRTSRRNRSGVAMIESAVVMSVVLLILFGLLDLGLAALNSNNLTDVAQQVTRTAIIRGKSAAPNLVVWGPGTYTGTAATGGEISTQAAAAIQIMPLAKVTIVVEWPDGGNDEGDRVRTTMTYSHPMIVPKLFGFSSCPLKAVSTMRISN